MLPERDFATVKKRLSKLGLERLQDYINSPAWEAVKDRFYAKHKDKYRCAACPATKMLELHHRHYRRLGREWLRDLCWLCGHCHDAVHTWALKRGWSVAKATRRYIAKRCLWW